MTKEWIELQRRHFNRRLSEYTGMYGADTPFHRAMTERLIAFAEPRAGQRVLDIGCGLGRVSIPLLRAGCLVTGLDISQPTLDTLLKRLRELGLSGNFQPLVMPAEEIDFPERFHLVTGRGILHHLKEPVKVLSRVCRALLPDGWAVFMDPNPLNPGWIPYTLFHPTLSVSIERHLLRGTPSRALRMLIEAGLKGVECTFTGLVPPPVWDRFPRAAGLERLLLSVPGLRRLALYLLVRGQRPGEG